MFYSKTQNDLIQFYCWWSEKKPQKNIFKKNLIFFILFIRTSDLFFRHEKINDD